ncbi:MAG: nucleotidyltransferase family protein [Methylococcales bacterium]|nr:nucleotidyltransferase family protein [Methylococcales bacterium]
MEAIILAGGFGTRLQTVVKDVPKPMAEINGYPFLKYLLDALITQGVTSVILSVGYKKECIKTYFNDRYQTLKIRYASEETPLGTGGAIIQALSMTTHESVYVLNGDTFFEVDLNAMQTLHLNTQADITVATKVMHDFDRYGTLTIKKGRVTAFEEKKYQTDGYINGGIYLIHKNLFNRFKIASKFSFEADFLEQNLAQLSVHAFESEGYFIDIGIPDDYYHASTVFHGK